jgi:hypothetical protein
MAQNIVADETATHFSMGLQRPVQRGTPQTVAIYQSVADLVFTLE